MNIELLSPIASMTVATRARRVVDWISTSSVAQRTQRDSHHRSEEDHRSNSNLQSHFNCQARNRTSNSFNCQTSISLNGSSNRREKWQWKKRSSASTAAHAGGRASSGSMTIAELLQTAKAVLSCVQVKRTAKFVKSKVS